MGVKAFLQKNIVVMDGGTGTLLQQAGLALGELPERWNVSHRDTVTAIHKAYFDAGSHIVCTNTFGANALKYAEDELETIVCSAIRNAKLARMQSKTSQEKYIALDIGPLGKLLKPYGQLDFEEAVEVFAKTVRLGVKYGVDLIYIETLGDSYETKAAVLAVKENSDLPVFVSCAYGADGVLMTGATPSAMVAMLEGLGVDALGANCSLGVTVPEVGTVYKGKVVSILEFGAFVEILPGKEGLLHISELDWKKVEKTEDVLNVGDEVEVKLLEIDSKTGKMRLSRKVLLEKPEGWVEPVRRPRPEGDRRDNRGPRKDFGNKRGPREHKENNAPKGE